MTQPKLFADEALHDPGGKVRLRVPASIKSMAIFGGDRNQYRYVLVRRWSPGRALLFVMMNPSEAGIEVDDPTVAACQEIARNLGFAALLVGNTCAYRATNQRELIEVSDPVGPDNIKHLEDLAEQAEVIIMAYGTPHRKIQEVQDRVVAAVRWGKDLHVLKLSEKSRRPQHPLYINRRTVPQLWRAF